MQQSSTNISNGGEVGNAAHPAPDVPRVVARVVGWTPETADRRAGTGLSYAPSSLPAHRFATFVRPLEIALATASDVVDGVTGVATADMLAPHSPFVLRTSWLYLAVPGLPLLVEAGGPLSAGDPVASDGEGRAVRAAPGERIAARALGPATDARFSWIIFASAAVATLATPVEVAR